MRVALAARIPEELRDLILERAVVEQRSVTNMIERLLSLGLGTVVTEREQGVKASPEAAEPIAAANGSYGGFPVGNDGSTVSRSVTAVNCPKRWTTHNPGTKCNECGTQFPAREFKSDPKVKP